MHALVHAATAAEITGRVVSIADGDTLTILDQARRQTRIRLAEIDMPEAHQPYGSRAKQALSELAFGKDVRVVVAAIDRYGRTVGRIYAGPVDISAELSARAPPGSTGNTTTILPCFGWSRRRTRRDAACGPCRRRRRTPPWGWRPRPGVA